MQFYQKQDSGSGGRIQNSLPSAMAAHLQKFYIPLSMHQYDLNIFSPSEFEEFSRDILQAKLNRHIESFKTGKDGGIDLRFCKSNGLNAIIQAKRYKSFSSLIDNLKKELAKVTKLNPDQYIITTSLGLSPHNKEAIKSLFTPYIKSTEDIYGKEDLINLLSQHKKIEEKYYKLWITSTTMLEKVLHSKIYNQSQFELEEINYQAKLYVQNKSLNEALNILKKHRYIIISGIPGIGKTTLSRILTFYLLANGYEGFIYLSDRIDDGYTYFKEGEKQIFLFDDFLGKNFFDARDLQKNDDKIVKFINKIKNSPDKVLILATREYILNQAKEVYEAFKIHNIEIAKCIIDLSTYTNLIKAKILYNHLFHGEIPEAHINNLLENKNYRGLITHPNYSPRIIETFIKQSIWNNCKPEEFYKVIKTLFDNPEGVWLFSFENSLDKFSQYVLLILSTLGTPVLLKDLELAVQSFFHINNYKLLLNFDSIKFLRSIRELENTFIKTSLDKNGNVSVEYQNPSIYDFLVNYLSNKSSIIGDLIDSFIFVDQTNRIFSGNKMLGKIQLNEQLIEKLADRIIILEKNLVSCRIYNKGRNEGIEFNVDNDFTYKFLNYLNKHFSSHNLKIKEFIYRNLCPIIEFEYSIHRSEFLELLESVDLSEFTYNEEKIMDSFFSYSYWIEDLELFERFKNIFPETYNKWIHSNHFKSMAKEIIDRELKGVKSEDASDYKIKIKAINEVYFWDLESHLEKLDALEKEYDEYINHQIDMYTDREFDDYLPENVSEDIIINEIFNSLKE